MTTPRTPSAVHDPERANLAEQAKRVLVADVQRTAAAARLLPAAGGNAAVARLCERVARLLLVPSVQLSLLTDIEIVAAGVGLPEGCIGSERPLELSLCAATAAFGEPLVISDAKDDARVADLPPIASGAVGAYLGVPLAVGGGAAVGALCVFDASARPWSDHDVALLEQLAGAVIAELELSALSVDYEASRLLWDLASDAAGLGSFDWDLRTDRVSMDERLQTLFGYAPGELVPHIAAAFSRIHPEDRPAVDAAIAEAVEAVGDYRAEFRVDLPGGQQRWLVVRGRAVPSTSGPSVQLLGTAYDITEVRTGRDQAAHLRATMATGFLSVDGQWVVTHLNAAGERAVGMSAQELVGRELWDAFPDLEGLDFGLQCKQAAATGEPVEFEAYYPHVHSWYEVRAVPSADGMALYLLDITARRADRQRAEAATTLLELVATVSSGLATAALDTDAAVAALARLVVPALADWCLVSLVDDDGSLQHVGCWHVDPDLLPVVEDFAAHRLEDVEQPAAVHRARRSRQPVITEQGAMALTLEVLQSPAAIAAITQLAPESSVVLPLVAHHTVLGVLTLCRGAARPLMSNEEILTAGEVAARAGLALDNARLYAEQRSLAEGLQRLVLADPPESNHGQIVVRYVPAAELAAVGGDWFDSFCQPDGATTLVIGDVVGHDTAAAAAMVEVRGLLRGIAWHTGSGPAEVLRGVDAAIEGLQVATTATAVVARLEQTPSERERGATRLRWSNAGHPPPMAIDADGRVSILAGSEVDLLLGFEPRTSRIQFEIALDRGATVLLYTDGLIEHRGEDLDTGLARLHDTLGELAHLPLDELCDELLLRMQPAADDDVAFIAVRLPTKHQPAHPKDANTPTTVIVERILPSDTRRSARSDP